MTNPEVNTANVGDVRGGSNQSDKPRGEYISSSLGRLPDLAYSKYT